MARSRRASFGPVVALGLASAALAAVGASKVWVSHSLTQGGIRADVGLVGGDIGKLPLAAALALLLCATWGILLVTRGTVRRAMAGFGVLVSLGLLACAVAGLVWLPGDVRDRYGELTSSGYELGTSHTGWFWVSAAAVVLAVVSTLLAVLLVPAWPQMGTRYDAPGAPADAPALADPTEPDGEVDDARNREIWKAIDEGRDPTAS